MSNDQQPQQGRDNCLIQINENLIYNKCDSHYDPKSGEGYLFFIANGQEYALEIHKDEGATYVAIEKGGIMRALPIRELDKLLANTPLAEYHKDIESIIRGLIMEAEKKSASTETRKDQQQGRQKKQEGQDCQVGKDLIVEKRHYDVESRRGFIELKYRGKTYRFTIQPSPNGKTYIIGYNGSPFTLRLSKLKDLLEGSELEPCVKEVKRLIETVINEAMLSAERMKSVTILRTITVRAGDKELKLSIGINDEGKAVLMLGDKRVEANFDLQSILDAIEKLLPSEALSEDVAKQVKEVLESIKEGIVTAEGEILLVDGNIRKTRLNSVVVGDKLVTLIPYIGDVVIPELGRKRTLLVLAIISDKDGKIIHMGEMPNPATIEVDGKVIYKDYLERVSLSEGIEAMLPDREFIAEVKKRFKNDYSISWVEAYEKLERIAEKYVYLEGVNKELLLIYAIAQGFFELITRFPIYRIIAEWGSGKMQSAFIIEKSALIGTTIVDPTEASIFRLADAFHPTIIIDETLLNNSMQLLLNAGYEANKYVPRTRNQEKSKPAIDLFNVYSPKVVVSKTGEQKLRKDTLSRIIEGKQRRVLDKVFEEPNEEDEEVRKDIIEMKMIPLTLRVRRWHEFLTTYEVLREKITGVHPRIKDTYLPVLAVAYLIAKDRGDPGIFIDVLKDMLKAAEERGGLDYIKKLAIIGILKHLAYTVPNPDGTVTVSVKDIAEALRNDLGRDLTNSEKRSMGSDLSDFEFKVRQYESMGHTKYVISIQELYKFVRDHNVDLSLLSHEEREMLSKVTKLDWESVGFNEKEWLKKVITELFGEEAAEKLEKSSSNSSLPTPTTPTTASGVQPNMESTNVVGVVEVAPKEAPTTANGETETNDCDSMCKSKYPGSDPTSMLLYGKCLMECAEQQLRRQQSREVEPQCEFDCRRRYMELERDETGYRQCLSKCLECPPGTRYDPYMDKCLRVMQ